MLGTRVKRWLAVGVLAAAAGAVCAGDGGRKHTAREDLVGAWRLVQIAVLGPQGPEVDPFYGSDSEGLLIYDAAGWFSVQIAGQNRPLLGVPNSRPQTDMAGLALKEKALDSYYAYYGTWNFDAASSTVTHHAKGALYPAEHDAIYAQHVEVHGATMTFTRSQGSANHRTVQTKVWERVNARLN